MSLRWFHKLGLTMIDKLIIAFVLFLVSLDISKGFSQIGWDLVLTCIIVLVLYLITVLIASIPKLFVTNAGRWTKWIIGGFTALMILLLFPVLLGWFFTIANLFGWMEYTPALPLQTVLMITFMFRAALV